MVYGPSEASCSPVELWGRSCSFEKLVKERRTGPWGTCVVVEGKAATGPGLIGGHAQTTAVRVPMLWFR